MVSACTRTWPFNVVFFLGLFITYNISLIQQISLNILYHTNLCSEQYLFLNILYHIIFLLSLLRPCNISPQYNICCRPFDTMQYFSLTMFFFHAIFLSKTIFLFHAILFINTISFFSLFMACNICIQYNISSWVS